MVRTTSRAPNIPYSQYTHLTYSGRFTHISHKLYKQKTCLSRHDTILLNRLRIGHTRLTHSFLLSGDDLPECGTCQCPLTVKHILVECVDLKGVRNKHFVAFSIKDLFEY